MNPQPTSGRARCDLCPRPATTWLTLGPDPQALVCAVCADRVMYELGLVEPEGYGGYLAWRRAAEADPLVVGLPPRRAEVPRV